MAAVRMNTFKISDFPQVTPTEQDHILVEQGEGKAGNITLSQIPVSKPVKDKIATEIKALDDRIDNIASLPPGSTTGDAELRDIRVGADGTVYPTAAKAVQTQVSNLQDGIDGLKGDLDVLEDRYDYLRGSNLFNKNTITSGIYIDKDNIIAKNELFFESDYIRVNQSTNYYLSTFTGGQQTVFYDKNKNFLSGILHENWQLEITTPENAYYMRVMSRLTNLDNFAIGEKYPAIYSEYWERYELKLNNLPKIDRSHIYFMESIIVVDKNGKGDYTTITEAVANANDNDTIFVKAGNYENEVIECWGKTIHIIGESRNQVIISNTTGAYDTPPIEIGSGTLKNVTIIAYYPDSSVTPKAYAIHIEDDNLFNKKLLIDNCEIVSYAGPPIGIGMRGGCDVEFNNLMLRSEGESVGLFMHDGANETYKGVQNCRVTNCTILTTSASQLMRIDSEEVDGSEVNYTFEHCYLKDVDTPSTTQIAFINAKTSTWVTTIDELTNCNLSKYSFNNNITLLNKN